MNERMEPRVRIEPSVSEAWFARVMSKGCSPTEFAEFVLRELDLDEWLPRFASPSVGDTSEDRSELRWSSSATRALQRPREARGVDRPRAADKQAEWTRDRFFSFLDYISSSRELQWSYALLGAYLRVGPIPTSEELQRLCGFSSDSTWQQALRVAKQKLTLHARKVEAPSLFPRAKTGTEGQRLHPIEPNLYTWLKEWATNGENGVDVAKFPAPESWGLSEDDELEAGE